MKLFRLHNLDEYTNHVKRNRSNYAFMKKYETESIDASKREFTVKGFSYPANQFVNFKVDYLYSDGEDINWRERVVCPSTQLNNRLRSCVHILDLELCPYPDSKIYITEQVTPLFSYLKDKFPYIIGSEYLGKELAPGQVINKIRHEDMTNLSFDSNTLDYYLSFECFEHIPFYKKAIAEIYRVLKPGGIFLGSFPFNVDEYENLVRTYLDEKGNLVHLREPEYHGDPVNEKGILCYTKFGWEILDQFRQAGFSNVYNILVWSSTFGYLGGEQVFTVVHK
jgi:SAM-dependent methyltransferase